MTYGKLRQFRRDRLYASDRDRQDNLAATLRKNRIIDDQQGCATGYINSYYASPNKTGQNKNFGTDGHANKSSPSKISPNKQV